MWPQSIDIETPTEAETKRLLAPTLTMTLVEILSTVKTKWRVAPDYARDLSTSSRVVILIAGLLIFGGFIVHHKIGSSHYEKSQVVDKADLFYIPEGADISKITRKKYPKLDILDCVRKVNSHHSDECSITFAKPGTFPSIQLLSFPGSGNTWTRHLVEEATGIFTGSVYDDMGLFRGGYCGEVVTPKATSVIMVKGHHVIQPPTDKLVLVIRNPYDALRSEFTRQKVKSHTKHPNVTIFNTEAWQNYARKDIKTWVKTHLAALKVKQPSLILLYEDLVDNTLETVEILAEFVLQPGMQFRKKCVRQHKDGNFKRKKGECTQTKDIYDNALIKDMEINIEKVRAEYEKNGIVLPHYEPQPVCVN